MDAVISVLSDHLLKNSVKRGWDFLPFIAERWDGLLTVGQEALHGGAPFVHGTPRKDPKESATKAVDVCPCVCVSCVFRLFRRHVINRTDDLIFLGQGIVLDRFIGITCKSDQTHVKNFYVAVGIEEQILRLDVPVNDASLVRVLQSTR